MIRPRRSHPLTDRSKIGNVREMSSALGVRSIRPVLAVREMSSALGVRSISPVLAVREMSSALGVRSIRPVLAVREMSSALGVRSIRPVLARKYTRVAATVLTLVLLAGCETAPKKDLGLERVRAQLEQLQEDEELAGYAPLALGEAERALRMAEQAATNLDREHLVYMAERRIQIARSMAQREQLAQNFNELERERNAMLIRASQLETEQARKEAEQALLLLAASSEDAERQRLEKEQAQQQKAETARAAELAREEAEQARRLAQSSASEAELARREAELAVAQMDTLKRQLENLQLRQTESGVVITLGDVLFETGQADLLDSARTSLVEVVDLLQSEPDKSIRIEGHTDSRGSQEANLSLSQQRADSVRAALVDLGVSDARMNSVGMGEDYPIASNEDEAGRARNRRVDVILLDDQ